MTSQHPLTDDFCYRISETFPPDAAERNNMRSAADWQLEQAVEWLKDNVSHSLLLDITDKGVTYPNTSKNDKSLFRLDLDWIAEDLRKAMRPTTTTTTQEEN